MLYAEKQLHLDSLILKHPIYYMVSTLDMTKLNHLAKTIGYSTFSSMGYTTPIIVAHCDWPTKHNQLIPSPKPTNPVRIRDRS
jgi:hypothetical protein